MGANSVGGPSRFGDSTAVTLGWTHERIEDVIDRILVTTPDDVFDAPGNIGDGRRDTLALQFSAALDALGIPGGRLRGALQFRDSAVTDPVTGETRGISEEKPVEGEVEFTQELPAWRGRWGVLIEHIAERETKYRFETDWAKARQLPDEIVAEDLATSEDRRTTFTYNQFGQVLSTTSAAGTPAAATTTNDWTNNTTTSCLTQTTDPTGAVTTFTCNPAGDVTQISQQIRAVGAQPSQTRTTDTVYDDLGRVTKVTAPSGGYAQTSYDEAGRRISVTRNLGPGAGHDPTATWSYGYDDAGHLLTETLPRVLDPATGQLAGADVSTQTEQCLENVKAILEAAGSGLSHVLRCGVFLIDMSEFQQMNAVYARMFGVHRPARTTIQAAGLPGEGLRVEIDCIAYIP